MLIKTVIVVGQLIDINTTALNSVGYNHIKLLEIDSFSGLFD